MNSVSDYWKKAALTLPSPNYSLYRVVDRYSFICIDFRVLTSEIPERKDGSYFKSIF